MKYFIILEKMCMLWFIKSLCLKYRIIIKIHLTYSEIYKRIFKEELFLIVLKLETSYMAISCRMDKYIVLHNISLYISYSNENESARTIPTTLMTLTNAILKRTIKTQKIITMLSHFYKFWEQIKLNHTIWGHFCKC